MRNKLDELRRRGMIKKQSSSNKKRNDWNKRDKGNKTCKESSLKWSNPFPKQYKPCPRTDKESNLRNGYPGAEGAPAYTKQSDR